MKSNDIFNKVLFFLLLATLFGGVSIHADPPALQVKKQEYESQQVKVMVACDEKKLEKCEAEMAILTNMLLNNDVRFICVLYDMCSYINNNVAMGKVPSDFENIVKKYANLIIQKETNNVIAHEHQLKILFVINEKWIKNINESTGNKYNKSNNDTSDKFKQLRKEKTEDLLKIWKQIDSKIDKSWSLLDHKKEFEPFVSPYMNMPRMRPEDIPDEKERNRYKEYLAKQKFLMEKSQDKDKAIQIQDRHKKLFVEHLVKLYTTPPLKTEELQKLLEEYVKNNEIIEEVLDSIKMKK
jgi:hypothetical protein